MHTVPSHLIGFLKKKVGHHVKTVRRLTKTEGNSLSTLHKGEIYATDTQSRVVCLFSSLSSTGPKKGGEELPETVD